MAILKVFPVMLLLLTSLEAADPSCRTPLGVSCHVIQYKWTQWVFFEKGITDIRHLSGQMTSGARRDGSLYGENVVDGSQRVESL